MSHGRSKFVEEGLRVNGENGLEHPLALTLLMDLHPSIQ